MRFNKFLNEHTRVVLFFGAMAIAFAFLIVPHYNKHKTPIIIDRTAQSERTVESHSARVVSAETVSAEAEAAEPSSVEPYEDLSANNNVDAPEKININTATAAQLETLPGIGPSFSKRIIDYREKRGEFYDIRELTKIPGIGTKRFGDIKDLICVE